MSPSSCFLFTLFSLTFVCCYSSISSPPPATPFVVAEEMIQWSLTNMMLAYNNIQTHEDKTTDPVLHDKYERCRVLYWSANNAFGDISGFIDSGEYQKMVPLASMALEQVEKCDKIFTPVGGETDFKSVSEITVRTARDVLLAVKRLASTI